MAGIYPKINDRDYDLWKAIAWNWYDYAVDAGVTGLNPPSWNDRPFDLMKKTAYYTAASVDIHP
jgi:hypothetical protein